jgi:hypothetical protein
VDYGDGSGVQTLALSGKTFTLQHLYGNDGVYQVDVCVSDGGEIPGCDRVQVTVNNQSPRITKAEPQSQTVQYSEAIAGIVLKATDVEADLLSATLSWSSDGGNTFWKDSPLTPALGDGSCQAANGTNTCTWKVSGTVGLPAGSYILRLKVMDDDGGESHSDVTLKVDPEEAAVVFGSGNLAAVKVATAGGSSGVFSLAACATERDVPLPGDVSQARVRMSLVPVASGTTILGVAGTPSFPNGSKCVTFSFNKVSVNTYTVLVTVDGGYYAGAGEDVLVVYDPSLGYTTGGGWFYWPGTAKPETGYPGDKTNFGYTTKNNKQATNIQGGLLLIRHMPDGSIYRVKSNALVGLALGVTPGVGWASFSGKSTYQEPTWPLPIGNRAFVVYVEDRNEPGAGIDRFWIKVTGSSGITLLEPAAGNAVPLQGGNIVVPHRAK